MAFLTLNGIEVPCQLAPATRSVVRVGKSARAYSGALRDGTRARKREWNLRTGLLSAAEALAFRGLIEGDGHAWPLDGELFSSRSLAAASGAATYLAGRYGQAARIAAGSTVAWNFAAGTAWTALHWRYDALAAAWRHITSLAGESGGRLNGGAPTAGNFFGLTVGASQVSLAGATNLTDFDDLVVLPFLAPASWVPALYASHNTRAWSALPRLLASGDILGGGQLVVRGAAEDAEHVEFTRDGVRYSGEEFDFILREA